MAYCMSIEHLVIAEYIIIYDFIIRVMIHTHMSNDTSKEDTTHHMPQKKM
jgi:hypothetical protein